MKHRKPTSSQSQSARSPLALSRRGFLKVGAAGLAGLATGVWPTASALVETRHFREFPPDAALGHAAAAGYHGWERAVDAALHWARNLDRP